MNLKHILYFPVLLLVLRCDQKPGAQRVSAGTEPSFRIAMDHLKVWDEAIVQVMELADQMPEDAYRYKPHDSVRTFAEQLVHIGESSKLIAHMYLKDSPPPGNPEPGDANQMSKTEIKEYVKARLEEVGELFMGMTDEMLREEITSFSGRKMTRLEGMLSVHDHLTNHKAKANLYIRLSGGEPPDYRYY